MPITGTLNQNSQGKKLTYYDLMWTRAILNTDFKEAEPGSKEWEEIFRDLKNVIKMQDWYRSDFRYPLILE